MSELSDLYQEVILDHSRHPHNFHAMEDATRKAEGYNPLCGDQVTVYLKLDGETIQDISFVGNGCAISKSSASVMTDIVKGKSAVEALQLLDKFRHVVTDPASVTLEENDKLAIFAGVWIFPRASNARCSAGIRCVRLSRKKRKRRRNRL